jgi:hypothetical protein
MANEMRINELLRWIPEEVADPVPPWLINILDKNILRDLTIVSLERKRAISEANIKAIENAAAIIRKAKF